MKSYPLSIKPFGAKAILVEWPQQVDHAILNDILLFVDTLKNQDSSSSWEWVPAYNSVTLIWRSRERMDFEASKRFIEQLYKNRNPQSEKRKHTIWKLPVCYEAEFATDIETSAHTLGISPYELIEQHTSNRYTVFGIGFLPGFMYLGGLPESLHIPRRKEPRLHVVKGSVGLAGKQTGIYPQDSPGGWHIIGNCPIPIFDASKEKPCFASVGDKIQFHTITKAEYDLRKIEAEIGIYNLEKVQPDA
ncbi:MAG: 5-oxoprolinase subunit PxpB [Bacteroidota bacterium]